MSRRDRLRRLVEPRPQGDLTNDEVAALASRLVPQFFWHPDENFFPESTADLTAERGLTTRIFISPPPDPPLELDLPAVVTYDDRGVPSRTDFDADDLDGGAYLGIVGAESGNRAAVAAEDDGSGLKKPQRPASVYVEVRDPLAALLADWRTRSDGVDDASVGPIDIGEGVGSGPVTQAQLDALERIVQQPELATDDDRVATEIDPAVLNEAEQHVFMEFYLLYAYNDIAAHQDLLSTWPANPYDHEGDVEASVIYAFRRDEVAAISALDDGSAARAGALAQIRPAKSVMMGHGYDTHNDYVIDTSDPATWSTDRQAFIGAGSHAAAPQPLTTVTHPTTRAIDEFGEPGNLVGFAGAIGAGGGAVGLGAALGIAALIFVAAECADVKDERSDEGARTPERTTTEDTTVGDREPPAPTATYTSDEVRLVLRMVPIGTEESIWDPTGGNDEFLLRRTYPGRWLVKFEGDGIRWRPKTGRALRVFANHQP